jgi:hypothetical protein
MAFFVRTRAQAMVALSLTSLIVACSDSDNGGSASTSNIQGWVGSGDLNNAQVVVSQIAESGQYSTDTAGLFVGDRESTDSNGRYTGSVLNTEAVALIARGQIADVDKDKDNLATTRQCQLVNGCSIAGAQIEFGDYYSATSGFEYRAISYKPANNSVNNVNELTTLAAAFGYQYDVSNIAQGFPNQTFSPYDIVLANSQVAELFAIDDVVGTIPANLFKLDQLSGDAETLKQRIRYGSLLAAMQQLAQQYVPQADETFLEAVTSEFVADQGQVYYQTDAESRVLTLLALYQAAYDNLNLVIATLNNQDVIDIAQLVLTDLESGRSYAAAAERLDTLTDASADELSQLLSASELEELDVGLQKTKLFVESLLDYQDTFWDDNYRPELDAYLNMLKKIGDDNKDNLNTLVQTFADIQDYYVSCQRDAGCDEAHVIHSRQTSYDASSKILKLDNNAIEVSQRIADINLADNISEPTESNAMDVLITGKLTQGNLVLNLAHDLNSDETEIDVPSAMRIYYTDKVSAVDADKTIKGYEIIWGDFELYDSSTQNNADEAELAGAFRIFYRGVENPYNPADELRFNIAEIVMSAAISDQIDDDAGDDREFTRLVITANANKANDFYPDRKLASFNGVFQPNDQYPLGHNESAFLTYQLGTENVAFGSSFITVETIDFTFKDGLAQNVRYRFYPDEKVEDELDSDGDNDRTELVDRHYVEECDLNASGAVEKCAPKGVVFDKTNLQRTINDLWETGAFQLTEVDSRGEYFVPFATVQDENGCLVLDTLKTTETLDGTLIEQQVLGLSSARIFAETFLEDDNQVDLARTMLDVNVIAQSADRYRVLAGLSHDYTSTTSNVSGVVVGTGSDTDLLYVTYDTSADFENTGSVSITKGGVTFTLGDGSQVTEDGIVTGYAKQTFNSNGSNNVHYSFIEDEEGNPDRCVHSVGSRYVKDVALEDAVIYLNYRGVVYGTARQEGNNKVWTIRYTDGSWLIPGTQQSGS